MIHERRAAGLRGSRAWNRWPEVIAPQFEGYQMLCSKAPMDDEDTRGYPFQNACMTESYGVELGPLPLPVIAAWGEGTKLRLVRSLDFRGWALLGATALCIALPGVMAMPGGSAHADGSLEERKLPMRFSWVACRPNCR